MNKQFFLKILKKNTKKLKSEERRKYIEYYDEMISDIVESGVSEEEAIKRQGSVEKIAADIIADANPANLKTRDALGICLIVMSVIMLLCCAVQLFVRIQAKISLSTAIGVIGGADGPTSIFVAGKIGTPWGLYILTAAVVVITDIYFVMKRKKN